MERLRPWLDAAKPEQASLAPLAVAVGAACAHFDGRPGGGAVQLVLALGAALTVGTGVNLIDHVWDAPGQAPPDAENPPPESTRAVDAREAAAAAAGCLLAAALLALGLAWMSGAAVLGYGGLALLLGLWRRAPAVGGDTLGFGLGDLATVAALGPLAVLAGFAAQAGEGSAGAFYAGIPVGLTVESAAWLRHFTRRVPDVSLRRMTPPVTLGVPQAHLGAVALPLIAAAGVLLARRAGEYAPSAWIAGVPMIAVAIHTAWRLRAGADEVPYESLERLGFRGAAATLAAIALTFWWGTPV
jgi:1,4-dihydroxy-2-naphthoate octaprenyltransferase